MALNERLVAQGANGQLELAQAVGLEGVPDSARTGQPLGQAGLSEGIGLHGGEGEGHGHDAHGEEGGEEKDLLGQSHWSL
jgi:hypothetical protein